MPAWSFGTSQRGHAKKSNEQGPGPGDYYSNKNHNNRPPTWRIGNQQRGGFDANDAPGPGTYDNSFINKRTFPQYQFGVKISNQDYQGITPGPGAYQQESHAIDRSSQQYSFGLRLVRGGAADTTETEKGPGPAAYETNQSTLMRPSSKIGNQLRGAMQDSQYIVPGVGNYNVRPTTAGPFHRFGAQTRDQFMVSKQTPGPGTYMQQSTLRSMSSGKTMSMRHLPLPDDREKVPGPGQYESYVEQVKRGNPKYRIGTALRRQLNPNELQVPGPGTYQSNAFDKKRHPSYKIGSEARGNIVDHQTPGPGSYLLKSDGSGLQYSLRLKPDTRRPEDTPGPQDYNPQLIQTNQRPASHKLGSERRDKTAVESNPGPDHYNLNRDLGGPKYPFGSESRGPQKGENIPGPGQYDLPVYFANNPEYSMPMHTQSQKSFSRATK